MKIIEIQDVVKKFGQQCALDGLSLSVEQGCTFGLLGPNGAGKTTLIRILTCIYQADGGTILFQGHPLTPTDVARIGYLPEERGLYKKMTVSEQAIYLARLRGLSRADAVSNLKKWFRKFEIDSWWNRRVEELSKGMQQKIQFIVTVVHQPDFLIFDEPFSGFDPINADLLKREILELKQRGATIILSTHNMASVEEICDDIALINHGRVLLEGGVNDVRRRFRKNQYTITLEGDTLPAGEFPEELFEILSHHTEGYHTILLLQATPDTGANALLDYFIHRHTVLSFNEVLPSMNDIFISSVQTQNKNH
ncbi:MAG: ATP-binding cassette domain-containing protein [Bacteroidales bacterium]|nr:ATP-binding cassette domain-containing protein [Bacteroidales bacterium]